MLVDDDKPILKVLGLFLKGEGHEVFPAENCHGALMIFEKEKIELVISDIMMPEMSGLALLNLLKQFYQKEVPVIIMSALNNAEITTRVNNMGAIMFFPKPVDTKKLAQVIRDMPNTKVA